MNPTKNAKSVSCCEDQQEIVRNFGLSRAEARFALLLLMAVFGNRTRPVRALEALCLPTLPVAAPAFGETDPSVGPGRISAQDAMTVMPWIASLTGLSAVSVSSGRNAAGLPVALTLMG